MTSVKMSIPNFVSVILIFCFTLSTFPTINGEPVNCETQNNTTCCNYVECSYINCTNATDVNVTHEGCHAKVNLTKLDGVCKKDTLKTICSGPDAANKCSLVGNETACCNTTINPGCAWLGACANTSMKLDACYNATDLRKLCGSEYTDSCQTEGTCSAFTTKDKCCNTTITKLSDCMFYECVDKTDPAKVHMGCHNASNQAEINKTCDVSKKVNQTCPASPPTPAVTCRNFTDNQTECCTHGTDLGCGFVNCNGPAKKTFKGCYKMSDVTCTPPPLDQCKDKPTTLAPLTTMKPTPEPVFEECQTLKNRTDCCRNLLYRCIFVNCSGTTTKQTYKGCYSASNQTTIQTDCGTTSYVDSCAATTPSSITTASPSTDKRHFDGASFIGGIVLCAGIILIIFFVLKWYKSRQTSSNYHQM